MELAKGANVPGISRTFDGGPVLGVLWHCLHRFVGSGENEVNVF